MSRLLPALRLLGVSGAGAGLAAAAVTIGLPTADLTSAGEQAAAARAPQTRQLAAAAITCAGPQTAAADDTGPITAATAITVAAPAEQAPPAGSIIEATVLSTRADAVALAGDNPARQRATLRAPEAVLALGSGAMAPGLTGEQTTLATSGDRRGLSSATCARPLADAWLVGGGNEAGRRGRLVLVNPAQTAVTVRVDVLSAPGPVPRTQAGAAATSDAAAPSRVTTSRVTTSSGVVVPARSRRVLLLDALAPGARSPVVHVRATAGAVAATLHDTWLSGTTPRGTDVVMPGAAAARRVLVPGLTVNGRAVLRLAAPGPAEAVALVRLLGPEGPVDPPTGAAVRVPARGTVDVDLTGLPPGPYAAEVRTDVPVVAGAMVERATAKGPADVAWVASVRPLRTLTGTGAVRSVGQWSTTIELSAPRTAAAVDVTTVAADGTRATQTLRVPAGASTFTVLADVESAWLRPVPGSSEVIAARTTTYRDAGGRLITAAALADLPTSEMLPVVRPAQ